VNERRPIHISIALAASAAVGFVGAVLLDIEGDWGEPRQAAADILWIIFLLSVLGLVVAGARMLVHRPRATR